MCTYNGAFYLREQMESLLAQTYPLHEIIVQDDGSTDDTWEILQEYARNYPHVKIFQNLGKHGINGNFFSALQRASGDYVAICDQDDIWESDKIAKQADSIGDSFMCGGFSKPFSSDGFPIKWDARKPCLHLLRLSFLSEIPGHVQLINRDLLDYLPALGECPYLYDWQLQFMASAAESLVFREDVLVNFRRHSNAATATKPISNVGFSGFRTFCFLVRNYDCLHRFASVRFSHVKSSLLQLQKQSGCFKTESVRLVLQLADYYTSEGILNYIRLTLFCIKHREKIFHAPEPKIWKSILRAFYFPLYSLNYYRGIIKSQ